MASGTPVAQLRDALTVAAVSGNPRARCRLGTELARCAAVFEQLDVIEAQVGSAAMLPPDSADRMAKVAEIAAARQALAPLDAACSGISRDEALQGWRYIHDAAAAGDLRSMLAFAITPPLSERRFTDQLDGWAAFRKDAVPMLERAARRGSARAINQLSWVYAGLPVPGGAPLVQRDVAKALAYASVARDLADPASRLQLQRRIQGLRSEATGQELARAASLEAEVRNFVHQDDASGIDFINSAAPQPEDCDTH